MSLHILSWIRGWRLDKAFTSFKEHADKVAIAITQGVKTAVEGTIAQTISAVIDETFKTHLAADAIVFLKVAAMKALAIELAIEGVPDNPTGDDILKFEQDVFKAITGKSPYDKSKLWTTFSAQMFTLIKTTIGENTTLTFAQIVKLVDDAYQAYLTDVASENINQ